MLHHRFLNQMKLVGNAQEESSSDGGVNRHRQQTRTQSPEKATRNASKAALSLGAELQGLSGGATTTRTRDGGDGRQRQKSVSEQVDGPRASSSELKKPAAALTRSAWLVEGPSGQDRAKFEKWVQSAMHGDYLVRESGSSAGFVLSVNDFGSVVNYPIQVEAELDEDGDATSDEIFKFMGLQFYSLEASAR
jgi:hypothetical protein